MKMMLTKIPLPIQASVVLLTFLFFAGTTAVHLNTPPAVRAAITAPSPVLARAIPVPPAAPVALDAGLVPALAELTPVSDAVCRDMDAPEALIQSLMAASPPPPPPRSDEQLPPKPKKPDPPFHQLILQAASAHNVEPALIRAVILAESNYNPKAVSKRGARGLMQLMPRTAASLGVADVFDPEENINGGVKYLRQLLDRFDNDVRLALAAYNAGSRHVRNYNGVPPFRATRLYIKKVFKYQALFQEEMEAHRQTV
ncbi:MAG: lytic transglycosylase domain-containing protein [Desulfosarcinaceae bacterium]|nr:lytic transglycosylase domain-containing protein [Desulfosarcinaceae bacterium]